MGGRAWLEEIGHWRCDIQSDMRSLARYFVIQVWQEVTYWCSALYVGGMGRMGMAIKSGVRAWFMVSGEPGRSARHDMVPDGSAQVSVVSDAIHLSV